MSTKAKPSVSAELERLQRERDQAHAKVREAKRKIEAHDAETEAMRAEYTVRVSSHPEEFEGASKLPKERTEAARQSAAIRERLAAPNPFQSEHDEAFAPYEPS